MTVEFDIYTALKAACQRVFNDFAPVGTQRPYVTFQQVGGDAVNFTDGTVPDTRNGVFQVNVWADKRSDSVALALQLEAALIGSAAFQAQPLAAFVADYDPDVPVYGTRQDFSIWAQR